MLERRSRCSPSPSASWSPPQACARWREPTRATAAVIGGGVKERDRAYHEGTVWPFLLGFYVRAAIRHRPHDAAHREALIRLVSSAADNYLALGQVPELADGDPPHRPSGCVAQAWSVAELLRALAWDLA